MVDLSHVMTAILIIMGIRIASCHLKYNHGNLGMPLPGNFRLCFEHGKHNSWLLLVEGSTFPIKQHDTIQRRFYSDFRSFGLELLF